jgi:Flp pilus assembly protein CpaB
VTRQQDGTTESKVLLENLLVLAVDAPANLNPDDKQPRAVTVTIACKPDQAEKLAQAVQHGELKVVTRKEDDERIGKMPDVLIRAMCRPDAEGIDQPPKP